jgi:hypothetical protein
VGFARMTFSTRASLHACLIYIDLYMYTHTRAHDRNCKRRKIAPRCAKHRARMYHYLRVYIRGTAAKYCARIDLASFLVSFSHANLFSRSSSLIYPPLIVSLSGQCPCPSPPLPEDSFRAVGRLARHAPSRRENDGVVKDDARTPPCRLPAPDDGWSQSNRESSHVSSDVSRSSRRVLDLDPDPDPDER